MPPIPGMVHWHSLIARHAKQLQQAVARAAQALDARLAGKPVSKLEPILVRNTPRQPLHPLARIRQGQNRWYSTARRQIDSAVRSFSTKAGKGVDRASLPTSRVRTAISLSSGRAPFATTLRPNLTGGTLGRTAGGYALGGSGRVGGARYFSHGPANSAQVVQNVSQAVRAFLVGGQKAQFDGISPQTGNKRYRAVSTLQEATDRKIKSISKTTPGSWVEFTVNPTITALTPWGSLTGSETTEHADHLNTDGLLSVLSVDFSRALKDLSAVLNDLNRLAGLGDLPITSTGSQIRVHFPGCDGDTVARLCDELNITRGTVIQDPQFDLFAGTEIALLFPFAPSNSSAYSDSDSGAAFFDHPVKTKPHGKKHAIDVASMLSPSTASTQWYSDSESASLIDFPSSPRDRHSFESIRSTFSQEEEADPMRPLEYDGFEGIYRFLEELDSVRPAPVRA